MHVMTFGVYVKLTTAITNVKVGCASLVTQVWSRIRPLFTMH